MEDELYSHGQKPDSGLIKTGDKKGRDYLSEDEELAKKGNKQGLDFPKENQLKK